MGALFTLVDVEPGKIESMFNKDEFEKNTEKLRHLHLPRDLRLRRAYNCDNKKVLDRIYGRNGMKIESPFRGQNTLSDVLGNLNEKGQ